MRSVEFTNGKMITTEVKASKILTVSKPLKLSQEVIDRKIITSCFCCSKKFKDLDIAYTVITKGHAVRVCEKCAVPLLNRDE